MDGLDGNARMAYFEMFDRISPPKTTAAASTAFDALYLRWYDRQYFIWPGITFFLIGGIAVAMAVLSGLHKQQFIDGGPLCDLPVTAIYAIAGAYLWVADDHISRARRLDFSPVDVHWATLRLIIAIPMGYAFSSIAGDKAGNWIAFALGAFPLATLIMILQRVSKKIFGDTVVDKQATEDDINQLQGVNAAIVERLADEDITTVTQFAYRDPVRLVMRSNLSFNFVTDCMSQALAWIYFETRLAELRALGLRGAVEIKQFDDDTNPDPHAQATQARAAALIKVLSDKLSLSVDTVQHVLRQMSEDPFTVFLQQVWTNPEAPSAPS